MVGVQAIAGMLSEATTYPAEILRRRMQVAGAPVSRAVSSGAAPQQHVTVPARMHGRLWQRYMLGCQLSCCRLQGPERHFAGVV